MPKQTIYTVGGTVQAGGGLYIKRKADDELLELCRQGEFAFILSSRQVGKSSLMVRTAQQLEKENIRSVTIDLSAIGVNVSQDEWYLGILNEVANSLNLETDIFAWWKQFAELGPAQRLTNFFRDILLKEVKEPIVLFFDEIDSTLSIPFSDDFYVAIRAAYNARSTTPDFKRLSFVLVGVATPGDLISDNRRTPFNIGHRVEVSDFTLAEALPLASGLGDQAIQVLTWVFQYTGGHPYLTQRLCAHLAAPPDSPNEQAVKNAVERLFTGEQGKQDNNLQFVRDMLSKRSPDVTRVLKIYKDIRSGKKVTDDERSIAKAHLKLSGLVRPEKGILKVRNEIYNSVFDLQWIQENTPKNWQKVALISLSASLGLLVLATLAVFINDFFIGTRVNESIANFISTTSSEERLLNLAEIYRQRGILSNTDSSVQAAQLFYGLSSAEDQLGLFRVYGIEQNPAMQEDLVTVVSRLYLTAANVVPEEDNTELLQAMLDALGRIPENSTAVDLKEEISAWVAGRNHASSENYDAALESYNAALSLNSSNHATLYERAKVYVALEQYNDALNDLDAAIAGAKQSLPEIAPTSTPTVTPSPASATPNPAEAQTRESPNMLSTAAVQTVQAQLTQTTTFSTPTATATHTPTATPTLTPTPTPQPTNISRAEKFESNFTTLIDVINAVRALIESTPGLQLAAQDNGEISYANLDSFGLIREAPTQALACFVGDWVPTAPDGGLARLQIEQVNQNTFSYHGWGDCTPDDCDWGVIELLASSPKLVGTFQFSFKSTRVSVECLPDGQLAGELFDDYTAADGRTDRTSSYTLEKRTVIVDPSHVPTQIVSAANTPTATPTAFVFPAQTDPFQLVYFSQQDPAWKDDVLGFGDSSETIGDFGDALTSLAMLLSGHGISVTPQSLNEDLKKVDGFVGAALRWNVVPELYPDVTVRALVDSTSKDAPLDQIDESIAAGQPVIVQVDGSSEPGIQSHWVLLYERTGDDYLMLDPWESPENIKSEHFLMQHYGQGQTLERAIFSSVFYVVSSPARQ